MLIPPPTNTSIATVTTRGHIMNDIDRVGAISAILCCSRTIHTHLIKQCANIDYP